MVLAWSPRMTSTQSQVVIGFDFSRSSRDALERAIAIAVRAPFHVLHFVCALDAAPVPSIPTHAAIDYLYAERVQIALTDEVEAELRGAAGTSPVHFCVHVRIGKPAEELLGVARSVGADLIIVGCKHITALQRLVLGSVSGEVARQAGCTVEIARPKSYPFVDLAVITEVEPHHHYLPPHRYTYQDQRIQKRPEDWPLY
jgi:nucleotide-binding universal stress UspA family protein